MYLVSNSMSSLHTFYVTFVKLSFIKEPSALFSTRSFYISSLVLTFLKFILINIKSVREKICFQRRFGLFKSFYL